MSNIRNAVIRQKTASDQSTIIYPTTHIDLVQGVGSIGRQLLTTEYEDATNAVFIANNNTVSTVTVANIPSQLGVAPASHTHTTDHIKNGAETITQVLTKKVPLTDGKISNAHLPTWIFGGMRYKGNINGTVNLNSTWLTQNGISSSDNTSQGYYFIATNTVSLTVTDNPVTIHYGDDGVTTTGNQTLENGDWLVYRGFTEGNYVFDIVNNTYATATTANYGTIKVAKDTITSRSGLSASGTNAVTEKVLKQVLRETILTEYAGRSAAFSSASVGDLLFVSFDNASELNTILGESQ